MTSALRVNEPAASPRDDAAEQLARVMAERRITPVFQPIFRFQEGHIIGHEALVRGPEGSLVHTPSELFAAAAHEGRAAELNLLCIQETVRAFSGRQFEGTLFLNVSPLIIMQRGFNRESVERFMEQMGLSPERVVIELTEDYPALDFRLVHESLMLYRSMGFRVAIDDLGEGFASLRLWSELKPEYVKADKHFVTGIANDPVKMQFLRAIQHIAESSGSLVIAEGIENAADFRVVKDIGIACGQGWFIGRPAEEPTAALTPEALSANADVRIPVVPTPRLRAGTEPVAHDFVRAVDAAAPETPLGAVLDRFTAQASLTAIPVLSAQGALEGVISRSWLDMVMASPQASAMRARACIDFADRAPIRAESDLDLSALTALLVESDARRMSDGFVILARGRYLGMGGTRDVLRSLQSSRVLAARYTNPLTLLPGQVPINEHLERLLQRQVPFTAWFVEIDAMRGLNDTAGFERGDALIRATAELLEDACEPGLDFAGHVSGSRFVVLAQSDDWPARSQRLIERFPQLLPAYVPQDVLERGYFVVRFRDGRESVRPLPKLAIGILPVLPGVFGSRHEVVAAAKHAAQMALAATRSAVFVDEQHGNAYPQSLLFGPG
ncbi:MAG TPA: GGDEF domain-containing protein [Usitatibacter sp.]|jgi:EAL domain-containing protein (putative c-di-GMP-specific phosphodiesterase class I)/GGDEF domain-containing protein|nr:GGDEF domain-containing protein [Usitatibacter sp.]